MSIDTATALEAIQKLCSFLNANAGGARNGSHDSHYDNANDSEMDEDVSQLFAAPTTFKHSGVDVEIAFLRAPVAHRVPLYFILPHEVNAGSICLITPPPQRMYKNKILALVDEKQDAVAARVARVIDSRKLNAKVSDPVTTRAFVKSFDNFVVYGVRKYPQQLTGEFVGHHRLPVWVARKGSFETTLHHAVKTAVVPRRGQNAVTCHVGHTGLTPTQLADNVAAFVQKFTHHHQAVPMKHILHIRVAGANSQGQRIGLTIFSHVFRFPESAASPNVKQNDSSDAHEAKAHQGAGCKDGGVIKAGVSDKTPRNVAKKAGARQNGRKQAAKPSPKRPASLAASPCTKRPRKEVA